MNVAQDRPRSWTPHIILFSIVLHAVVIYYIAVAFHIVPPLIDTRDPPVIKTVTFSPPPPPLDQTPEPIKKRPLFQQRPTTPPPINTQVPQSPFQPTTAPATGPASIDVLAPIPEQPISQALPAYPPGPLARGIEGRVRMSITIMPDGSVRDVKVIDARPRGQFDAAAVRAVQNWRYRPSGVIRTNVIVDMDFELRDG